MWDTENGLAYAARMAYSGLTYELLSPRFSKLVIF